MFAMHNDILFVALCGLAGLFVLFVTVRDRAFSSHSRGLFHLNTTKTKKGDRHDQA